MGCTAKMCVLPSALQQLVAAGGAGRAEGASGGILAWTGEALRAGGGGGFGSHLAPRFCAAASSGSSGEDRRHIEPEIRCRDSELAAGGFGSQLAPRFCAAASSGRGAGGRETKFRR